MNRTCELLFDNMVATLPHQERLHQSPRRRRVRFVGFLQFFTSWSGTSARAWNSISICLLSGLGGLIGSYTLLTHKPLSCWMYYCTLISTSLYFDQALNFVESCWIATSLLNLVIEECACCTDATPWETRPISITIQYNSGNIQSFMSTPMYAWFYFLAYCYPMANIPLVCFALTISLQLVG